VRGRIFEAILAHGGSQTMSGRDGLDPSYHCPPYPDPHRFTALLTVVEHDGVVALARRKCCAIHIAAEFCPCDSICIV